MLVLRGVMSQMTRDYGVFKLLRIHADPSIAPENKVSLLQELEERLAALYGKGVRKKQQTKPETIEDYYARVISAFKAQQ
jgi:hypothetical protein